MKKAAAIRTRWGILGTSAAAQQFALGLAYLGGALDRGRGALPGCGRCLW